MRPFTLTGERKKVSPGPLTGLVQFYWVQFELLLLFIYSFIKP